MRSSGSIALILDRDQPEIARASALPLLSRYLTPASEAAIKAAIADPSALVRSAAPRALPATLSPARWFRRPRRC